jgi:16S rRNA (guanine966-N2)-methyltransferase
VGSHTDLDGATVLDLFAGTGALGIEALSRGAAAVTFVDDDRTAVALVADNLAEIGLSGGTVVRSDAVRFVRGAPAVDVAFVDPPYTFDDWAALLGHLRATLAVLESDRPIEVGDRWEVLKVKRYGGTVVTLAQSKGRQ